VASKARAPRIYVLAGTNGAGKSSIGGAMLIAEGGVYFNPDEAAARIRAANPSLAQEEAQSVAWHEGRRLLERVIAERLDYAFETTLGGNTVPALLDRALSLGFEVRIWYVGLSGAEAHIARVRARVAHGGHDIPESRIRERYARSLLNLIQILPKLTELRVYDNSHEADPYSGLTPKPQLILHLQKKRIVCACDLPATPGWAKPIVLAALQAAGGQL
jgi:predicted ABC-type ATPase